MFVPKDDKLRYKILSVLVTPIESLSEKYFQESKFAITTEDLAKRLNTIPVKIRRVTSIMQGCKEVRFDDFGNGECLVFGENSYPAYADEKYLKEGRKRINDNIYDIVKWLMPLTLCSIAVCSLIYTITETRRNKQRIELMQQELDTLKYQKK
jgi:hypothetical protein